jgi:hypothetical protein
MKPFRSGVIRMVSAAATIAAICGTGVAGAQTAMPARPPVELNLGGGLAASWYDAVAGGHAGITVPVYGTVAIEGFVAAGPYERGTAGLYAIGAKQRIGRASGNGFDVFVTYELAGYFQRARTPRYEYTGPNGTREVVPAYDDSFATVPFLALVGMGAERRLAPHLAVRVDAQVVTLLFYPGGIRAAASVAVPLGAGYSRNSLGRRETSR